jgi:hypothetical protein
MNNTDKSSTAKKHFIVARICIFLSCFIYADSYFIPFSKKREAVIDKKAFSYSTRKSRGMSYNIKTSSRNFDAPAGLYHSVVLSDTVLLQYSPITGSIQKVTASRENDVYTFETGYVRYGLGEILVPVVLLGLILYHIFYFSIAYLPGRRDLLYALLVATVILFMFHLGIVIF